MSNTTGNAYFILYSTKVRSQCFIVVINILLKARCKHILFVFIVADNVDGEIPLCSNSTLTTLKVYNIT